jgi:hypothetical protein
MGQPLNHLLQNDLAKVSGREPNVYARYRPLLSAQMRCSLRLLRFFLWLCTFPMLCMFLMGDGAQVSLRKSLEIPCTPLRLSLREFFSISSG